MIALVETEKKGEMSLEEYITLMALQLRVPIAKSDLMEAFKVNIVSFQGNSYC